jgi:hypothetical protein
MPPEPTPRRCRPRCGPCSNERRSISSLLRTRQSRFPRLAPRSLRTLPLQAYTGACGYCGDRPTDRHPLTVDWCTTVDRSPPLTAPSALPPPTTALPASTPTPWSLRAPAPPILSLRQTRPPQPSHLLPETTFPIFNRKPGVCERHVPPFRTFSPAVDTPVYNFHFLPANCHSLAPIGTPPDPPLQSKGLHFTHFPSHEVCGKTMCPSVQ